MRVVFVGDYKKAFLPWLKKFVLIMVFLFVLYKAFAWMNGGG